MQDESENQPDKHLVAQKDLELNIVSGIIYPLKQPSATKVHLIPVI